MRVEHLAYKGSPLLPIGMFAATAILNTLGLAYTGVEVTQKIDLVGVFGWPAAEELMFRLFPIATLAGLTAAGIIRGGPSTVALVGVVSSLAFAGEHYFDKDGEYVEQSAQAFAERFGGGMLLYYLARNRGILNSYGAHAGLNASIWASAKLL